MTVILFTMVVSAGAACLLWRDLLAPGTPPAISVRQRQFGAETATVMDAALDRPLPPGFSTKRDLTATVDALRDATGLNFFVNWRALEAVGVRRDTRSPVRQLGGTLLGDAILTFCLDVHPALTCQLSDDVLTITTTADASRNVVTRVYDVRDLIVGGGVGTTQLEAQLRSNVSPDSWRGGDKIDAVGSVRGLAGQLIVTATPVTQHDVVTYLD